MKVRNFLACAMASLALAGCKGMFGPQGVPADPLYADRKPIESKASAGSPMATPDREPTPPVQAFGAGR